MRWRRSGVAVLAVVVVVVVVVMVVVSRSSFTVCIMLGMCVFALAVRNIIGFFVLFVAPLR